VEKCRHAVITGGEGELAGAIAGELNARGYLVDSPAHGELDVTNPEQVASYFSERPDIMLLINAAGLTRDAAFGRLSTADRDLVFDVNLTGALRCSREAIRQMVRARNPGHVIQIGSFAALHGNSGQSAYAAAKAGLIGFTHSIAREFGRRDIRANCILPGFLRTRMTADLPPEVIENVRAQHCLDHFTTPQDTARFIATLDSLPGISGQVFNLDSRITRW
jgi:3-oxoacyl-[acyl-carrier protein] reductase